MKIAILLTLLFDDFHYVRQAEMLRNGWIVRSEAGWPGFPGAGWAKRMTFIRDGKDRVLRLSASTDGTRTDQAQICHERKYLEGTYAARVRFSDAPVSGPDGDQVVETFYMISPLVAPMHPDYSEIDFEYLPNGGWSNEGPTMYGTTWETFSPEPNWKRDNDSHKTSGTRAGWRTLVARVTKEKVEYFIDGAPFAEHSGRVAPEVPMSINFNVWFIRNGLLKSSEPRTYEQDVDWVFFSRSLMTPEAVDKQVRGLRRKGVRFRDTVPARNPKLVSPCNF